jgi:type IV pilus assembly protein PilC
VIRRKQLIEFCRQLGNLLDAGVPITRALNTLVSGARGGTLHRAISTIAAAIGEGESLEAAFARKADYFPPLFLKLLQVGERTGTVDTVLRHMADYYEGQDRLIKNTLANLIYPAVQFTVAILVIAAAKYLVGALGADTPTKSDIPSPISAFGATGASGAVFFLLKWFGSIVLLVAAYYFVTRVLRGKRVVDECFLRIPVIGHTLRTLAVARFCWAFQLMMKAGVGIEEGLLCSLEAAGNAAFASKVPIILETLRTGVGLRGSLEAAGIFPATILEIVHVGETSGKIDQCLEKAAQQSFESAAFALKALAQAFTWLVWAFVAGYLVYYIFSLYSGYLNTVNSLLSG